MEAVEGFFARHGDPRVAKLALMAGPWQVLAITAGYLLFSCHLGPRWLMAGRPALNLVRLVRCFNALLLLLNLWLLARYLKLHNLGRACFGCANLERADRGPNALEHIQVSHAFLLSRILELADTVWLVLRKKRRQISFLHVFHHAFVLLMSWFYFKLAPGGSSAMFPIVNGSVHTIMYLYYILSTFPGLKRHLWWKRYVTRLQLAQFVVLALHFLVAALTPRCKYPRPLSLSGLAIAVMFFGLFIAFYRQTYSQRQQTGEFGRGSFGDDDKRLKRA